MPRRQSDGRSLPPLPGEREETYMLVRHARVADHLAVGWMVVGDLGDYHGQYSVLMQWLCPCRVPEVPREVTR